MRRLTSMAWDDKCARYSCHRHRLLGGAWHEGLRGPAAAGGQPWLTNCATTWRLPTPRSRGQPRHPYVLATRYTQQLPYTTTLPHALHMATHIHMQRSKSKQPWISSRAERSTQDRVGGSSGGLLRPPPVRLWPAQPYCTTVYTHAEIP